MDILLRVEDRFALSGRGLVIAPDLPLETVTRERFAVVLRRPDGSTRAATASIDPIHTLATDLPIDRRWRAVLTLHDVHKDDVPVGTEVLRA